MTTGKTNEAILEIENFRRDVREQMNQKEMVEFSLGEVSIDDEGMRFDGMKIEKDAVKKILSYLRVKPNFLGLSKMMQPPDWQTVKEKLKSVGANQQIWGRKNSATGTPVIDEIYLAFPKNDRMIPVDVIFSEIIDAMTSSSKEMTVRDKHFFAGKDKVVVTLLDEEIVTPFPGAEWRTGRRIVWDEVSFSISYFFEEKNSGAGVSAQQFGFKSDISNKKYNLDKIHKVLINEISTDDDKADNHLVNAATHLKAYNASVRELLMYRKLFFPETISDDKLIVEKVFDFKPLDTAYGCIVEEKPSLWQSSADTGINAYKFLFDVINIASNPEFVLEEKRKIDLQAKAASLLFKKKLDIEIVAPKISI